MPYIGRDIESITFNSANNLNVVGNITLSGTVDGRDVAADGTKLDTVATSAIANLLEDTTPQLGGNLDLNTNNVIGTGNINVTGSITGTSFVSTGDMSFTNNSKAKFGTSPSLEIFHDGSNSILNDVGAGNFKMQLAGADKLEVTSTGVDVTGVITTDGMTTSANINFGDNDKAIFGAGSDFEIFHDGSNTYLAESGGTGNVYLRANNLVLLNNSNETYVDCVSDGAVTLYHNNQPKIATTSTGVDVTGVITTDGMTTSANINFGDDDKAIFGAGSDLQIYHASDNHSNIRETGSGNLQIWGSNTNFFNTAGNKYHATFVDGGAVTLYHNGAAKLATTSTGVDVTGTVTTDALDIGANNPRIRFDDSDTSNNGEITLDNTALRIEADEDNAVADSLITFRVDGSERMRIDSSGTVTVGDGHQIGDETTYDNLVIKSSTDESVVLSAGGTGQFIYKTGSTTLDNGNEKMRITSSGDVGIGRSDPQNIVGSHGGGLVVKSASGRAATTTAVAFQDSSGNNQFQQLHNGQTTFSTGSTERLRIEGGGDIRVATAGRIVNEGGIFLGGTASANHLDDYEEGGWTPNIGGDATYHVQQATYTKIGRAVYVWLYLQINARNTSAQNLVYGLPFAPGTSNQYLGMTYHSGMNVSVYEVHGNIRSDSTIRFDGHTSLSGSQASGLNIFVDGTSVIASGVYYTT